LQEEGSHAARTAGGEFEGEQAAEGDAEDGGIFEAAPVKEFAEVVREVAETEASAQGETVVFSAELVADDTEVAGKQTSEGPEQFEAAGEAGDENERRSVAPFAVAGGVVLEMGPAGAAGPGTERIATAGEPIK
jgi:hypothetical protein